MGNIKTALRLIKFNWSSLWRFEILFMLGGTMLISLVCSSLLRLTMRAQGIAFISSDNLVSLLINPLTWLYLIFIILFVAFVCLFEASCLMFLFDASRQEKKADMGAVFLFGWKNSIRLFKDKGKNAFVIVEMIVLMPFFGVGALGSFFGSIQIPEFISEAIEKNTMYSAALVVAAIVLIVFVVRWCFALHYYTIDSCNARESRKNSVAIGLKNRVVALITALVIVVVTSLIVVFVGGLTFVFVAAVYLTLDLGSFVGAVSLGIAITLALCVILFCAVFALPLSTLALSVAFYRQKEKRGEEIKGVEVPEYRPIKSIRVVTWVVAAVLVAVVAGLSSLAVFVVANNGIDDTVGTLFAETKTEVTAHRGGSHDAPENTMAAFKKAASKDADWCELDVQMSSDGKLFIMHDSSFSRTCGVDKNTWELTWDEIQKLDASYGWTEYAGEKVPSLEEVIDWAKTSGMKLNIEIKPTGHEPSSLEDAVVDMINAKDFKDQCWVASLNYDVLEKVKAKDPSIQTLLNMVLAYGNIATMDKADNFSVEATSATEKLVASVHAAGKNIAVWTVNNEDNMTAVVLTGVDNIVTDEVTTAQNKVELLSRRGIARIMHFVSDIKNGGEAASSSAAS